VLFRGLLHVKKLACHARYASTAAIVASKLAVTRLLDASDAVLMMSKLYFLYSLLYLLFPLLPVVSLRTRYVTATWHLKIVNAPKRMYMGAAALHAAVAMQR
jgi:hypothetical protein